MAAVWVLIGAMLGMAVFVVWAETFQRENRRINQILKDDAIDSEVERGERGLYCDWRLR